jgi:hypothetical protein
MQAFDRQRVARLDQKKQAEPEAMSAGLQYPGALCHVGDLVQSACRYTQNYEFGIVHRWVYLHRT